MEKYKTGSKRFFASIIDGQIISLVYLPVSVIDSVVWNSRPSLFVFFIWISFFSSLSVVYVVCAHAHWGQTLGKQICGVRVVNNNSESRISYRQAILRSIVPVLYTLYSIFLTTAYYANWLSGSLENQNIFRSLEQNLTFIIFFWTILEIITLITNKKRRALHDLIAKTVVIIDSDQEQTRFIGSPAFILILFFILRIALLNLGMPLF